MSHDRSDSGYLLGSALSLAAGLSRATALVLTLSCAAACGGDSNEEAIRAAALSEGCVLSSDCANNLICAFRRCHVECNTSRDCRGQSTSGDSRCVLSEKPTRVCQLEDEVTCDYNSECPGDQVCAVDGECRDACVTTKDCVSEQVCASGACADPDELDASGALPNGSAPVQACLYSSDCPTPQVCRAGACAAECLGNRDCQATYRCDGEVCVPTNGGSGGAGGSGAGGTGAGGSSAGGSGGVATGGEGGSGGLSSGGAPGVGTCSNGIKDGSEVDVDCGGGACFGCTVGQTCDAPADCVDGTCSMYSCAAPTCDDGVRNGGEQNVDCGGDCAACVGVTSCTLDSECAPGSCQSGQCRPAGCSDGVKNGNETSVDCGGPTCAPCEPGQLCVTAGDCDSERCLVGRCADPTCSDGIANGDEVGTDCGGSCQLCPAGSPCSAPADCSSRVCDANVCALPGCGDGVANGAETDIDCGGPTCAQCGAGKVCADSSDCVTSSCTAGSCAVVPGCTPRDTGLEVVSCAGTFTTDIEPNNWYSQATPICLGQKVVAQNVQNDVDYFVFDTPDVPYGGYVTLTGGNAGGAPDFNVYNDTAKSLITGTGTASGGTSFQWFAVGGGERFYIKQTPHYLSQYDFDYEITVEWYPTFDCFEPNNSRAEAKRIQVGNPVSALIMSGWKATDGGNPPGSAKTDWYIVSLAAGPTSFAVTSVPGAAVAQVVLYNLSGTHLGTVGASNAGADVSMDRTVTVATDYHVAVLTAGGNQDRQGLGLGASSNFVDPYTLTITQ